MSLEKNYRVADDLALMQELLGMSRVDMANSTARLTVPIQGRATIVVKDSTVGKPFSRQRCSCRLCTAEREAYLSQGRERTRMGRDKAKVARRQYRGQGRYIEELFDAGC